MKNNTNSNPVYFTIFSEIRDKIVNGFLAPGQILPSENDLCARYGASRETVRKGLKQLEREGLVYSLPRRGYFVNKPRHDEFTLTFPQNINQGEVQFKDIRILQPTDEIREALRLPAGRKVIAFYRANYLNGQQFGLEIKYIPYDKGLPSIEDEINFAVFPEAANAKTPSFSYYTELVVSAVTSTEALLPLWDCEPGSPLLLLKRIFITQAGQRIGYSKHYLNAAYGELRGVSGYVQKNP